MKTREIEAQIRLRAKTRFEVTVDETLGLLAETALVDVSALKVRRVGSSGRGGRTILLAAIDKIDDWTLVSRWSAQVRDVLPEPETSDLYLFLVADGFSAHNRSRIESDEQFCRKYVAGSVDELPGLLDRTFMASLSSREGGAGGGGGIANPITAAFQATQEKHTWLTEAFQQHWLNTFLTEKPGKDLVPQIIGNIVPKMDS